MFCSFRYALFSSEVCFLVYFPSVIHQTHIFLLRSSYCVGFLRPPLTFPSFRYSHTLPTLPFSSSIQSWLSNYLFSLTALTSLMHFLVVSHLTFIALLLSAFSFIPYSHSSVFAIFSLSSPSHLPVILLLSLALSLFPSENPLLTQWPVRNANLTSVDPPSGLPH